MLRKSILYGLVGVLAGSAIPALIVSGKANSQAIQSSPCNMTTMHSAMAGKQQRHFIEMMIPHHQEAVEMALALAKTQRPEIRKLAESIKTEQIREIEQMRSWYKQWYGTEVPATAMTGMEMRHERGQGMQGMMMMQMDIESLRTASDFDREFIRQMIPHHHSGVMMARMVANRAERPEIRNLAQTIIQSQSAEINQMQQWYQTWYQ